MDNKLHRIPSEGTIAGVCAGIAEYFKTDVTLVRVLAVIALFATDGAFIVIYFIMALILPSKGNVSADKTVSERVQLLAEEVSRKSSTTSAQNWAGFALIAIGLWLTAQALAPNLFMMRWDVLWAAILVIIGLVILAKGRK